MNTARELLFPGLVVLVTTLIGVYGSVESRAQAPSPTGSITGSWTLNKDLSDKPQARAGRGEGDTGRRRGGGGGMGGYGRGGGGMGRGGGGRGGGTGGSSMSPEDMQRQRDAMRDVMNAPDRLTIVQTDSMIVMTTGDGRVTRLAPDGKKIKDDNTKIERKTKWDGGKLVSEINGLGPAKITETYSVDPEHRQLIVQIAIDNSRAPQPTTERRVYDPEPK